MRTYEELMEIVEYITENWTTGKEVVANAFAEHKKISMKDFVASCTACGGNWGGMLLTGMKKHYPKTYEAVPEDMGHLAFFVICDTLTLCGVYEEEEK